MQDSEVLAGGSSVWSSVGAPCVIKVSDNDYRMWYTQGKTDVTAEDIDAMDAATFGIDEILEILDGTSTVIGYTTSSDGIDWGATEEVLAGDGSAWNSIANPSVVQSSSYEMWYTQGKTNLTQVNLGTLLDETADLAEDFWDILEAFGSGNITQLLNNLSTLEDDISTIEGLLGNTRTVIGYATSTIGTAWTVQSSEHLVGSSTSAWSSVAAPSVVKDGTTYYMWYTEGIDDLTVQNLVALVLGTDLPIGYAYYTPSAPAVGRGGAAPVVAPAVVPGISDVTDFITAEGAFTETVTAESFDSLAQLLIYEGTKGLTKAGEPLSEISMTEMEEPPAPPADSSVIGLVYDFGPNGATFDPAITLTFTYDPALIPEGIAEKNLVIAMWDSATGKWVELDSTVDPDTNTITAKVSHFTAFTVLAYTRPAAFSVTDLAIAPNEVDIGERVTISLSVANTGDLTGSHKVTLKIDNVVVATEDVTLAGGASQKITFTTAKKDVAGTYQVEVDGLSLPFTVKPPPPKPAAFATSTLTISPTEVDIGQRVTISVLVANTGELSGSYTVTLTINKVVVATRDVTLAGGASQKVTFITVKDVAGTYQVEVDGLTESFTVKPPPPEPTKPINWWLIGGIIAGVIIIGVIISLAVRRREA